MGSLWSEDFLLCMAWTRFTNLSWVQYFCSNCSLRHKSLFFTQHWIYRDTGDYQLVTRHYHDPTYTLIMTTGCNYFIIATDHENLRCEGEKIMDRSESYHQPGWFITIVTIINSDSLYWDVNTTPCIVDFISDSKLLPVSLIHDWLAWLSPQIPAHQDISSKC